MKRKSQRSMFKSRLVGLILSTVHLASIAEDKFPPGIPASIQARAESSPLRSWFLPPVRIVWQSERGVKNVDRLLQKSPGQTVLKSDSPPCVLTARSNEV